MTRTIQNTIPQMTREEFNHAFYGDDSLPKHAQNGLCKKSPILQKNCTNLAEKSTEDSRFCCGFLLEIQTHAGSGLYYFRARYYDAELGRFISRDPLGYVDGLNLYGGDFVPLGVDPSGAASCDPSNYSESVGSLKCKPLGAPLIANVGGFKVVLWKRKCCCPCTSASLTQNYEKEKDLVTLSASYTAEKTYSALDAIPVTNRLNAVQQLTGQTLADFGLKISATGTVKGNYDGCRESLNNVTGTITFSGGAYGDSDIGTASNYFKADVTATGTFKAKAKKVGSKIVLESEGSIDSKAAYKYRYQWQAGNPVYSGGKTYWNKSWKLFENEKTLWTF